MSSFICLPERVLLKENGVAVGARTVYVAANQFNLKAIVKCICRCFKCIRLKLQRRAAVVTPGCKSCVVNL